MAAFIKNPETGGKLTAEERDQLADALATEATGKTNDAEKRMNLFGAKGCLDCHNYGEVGGGMAPQLKGWGSTDWLTRMISNPNDASFYGHLGKNQTMPAFGKQVQFCRDARLEQGGVHQQGVFRGNRRIVGCVQQERRRRPGADVQLG
jgi:hypothetical protein